MEKGNSQKQESQCYLLLDMCSLEADQHIPVLLMTVGLFMKPFQLPIPDARTPLGSCPCLEPTFHIRNVSHQYDPGSSSHI